MLEEFKDIYDIHDWLRYVTWLGLLIAAVFLFCVPGGFPPQAWLLFFQFLSQLSHLWDAQGAGVLLPLLALLLLSLLWLACWGAIFWACFVLIRHHHRQVLNSVRRKGMRWLSTRAMRREGIQITQFMISRAQQPDSPVTLPKLSLPQRFPQLQAVTLSSLATIDYNTPPHIRTPQHATPSLLVADPPFAPPVRSVPTLPLEVGVGWNAGIVRQRSPNEDSVMVLQNICSHRGELIPFSLLVVADGMGGHKYGQEASRLAILNMMHTILQNILLSGELSDELLRDMLVGGVDWANRAIYQRGRELDCTMGTTMTAALIVGMRAYIVNIGDSRTYLYREGAGLRQISHDHSVVATLVAFGEITPDEVYTHPERGKIYRCVGSDENVDVDDFVVDLCRGDKLLLCSDGLWEMVRDPTIARILQQYQDPTQASAVLIEAALRGGGVDNVSAVVARVP
jgi:serine/threonine protein phosphatase PrpC